MTELERIIAEMRSLADALMADCMETTSSRLDDFADRLAALAGAAPAKVREDSGMAVLDKYAEVARALGFEGDAWFNDPLASHAEIVARANAFADEEWKAKLKYDMEAYAQALAEERDAEWRPMETAPQDGVILLAVEGGSERKTFVAEASHEARGMVWCITTGCIGWTDMHSAWTPVGWRHLPERAALATFAEGE